MLILETFRALGITNAYETFKGGVQTSIRNGKAASLWGSRWIRNKTLRKLIQGPLDREEKNLSVASFNARNGWWD